MPKADDTAFSKISEVNHNMNIYETIGICWVILTSAIATVEVLYLAYIGLRVIVPTREQTRVVKFVPVTWGSREHPRAVDVRV